MVFILSIIVSAQKFWQHSNGPYAANVLDIEFAPSGTIYISNYFNGIHKSMDSGASWELVTNGIPEEFASILLINSVNFIYAGTVAHGLYRSTDNGISWNRLINLPSGSINSMFLMENDIINVCNQNGLFQTLDNGETWQSLTSNLTNIWMTTFTRNSQHKIFIGTSLGFIYMSNDEGTTWDSIKVSDYSINVIAININNDIYVGAEDGIYKSSNNGLSWTKLSNGLPTEEFYIIRTNSSGYVFAIAFKRIFYSFNNGQSWSEMNQELGFLGSFTIDSNNHIYAGSNYWGRGMYKSTNNGFDWQVINNGIKNSFITSLTQAMDSTIWVGTWGTGLFYSVNNGSAWNYTGMATKKVSSIKLDYNNNIFIATSDGVYFSEDNGTSWIDKSVGMTYRRFEDLIIINDCIYAGTYGAGLYRSCNGGNSWTKISYSLPSQMIYKLAILEEYLLCGTSSGIYKTSNDGASWEPFFSMIPDAIFVTSDDDVYVGTGNDGAFLSRDKGQTWISLIGNGLLAGMINTFGEDLVGNIYAGTDGGGVYVTLDDGYTWSKLNNGLPYLDINVFLSSLDGYMYAGTIGGGLYRSIDPISSIKSGETNFNIESFTLSQNYPNPFNPSTVISYRLPVIGFVTLKVYDILGREVATLVNEEKQAGEYEVEFNTASLPSRSGSALTSGIYFYQLLVSDFQSKDGKAGVFSETKKMILLK
jgi:photosystem II stability/assembly factor-like uncharacterized protein